MDQLIFADMEYDDRKHKIQRKKFLVRMDALIPWPHLVKKLKKHYPKGIQGRPPYPLKTMLRIHCMQPSISCLIALILHHRNRVLSDYTCQYSSLLHRIK